MAGVSELARRVGQAEYGLFIVVGMAPRKVLRQVEKETGRRFCRYVLKTVEDLIRILDGPAMPVSIDMTAANRGQAAVLLSAMDLRHGELIESAPGGLILFLSEAGAEALAESGPRLHASRTALARDDTRG